MGLGAYPASGDNWLGMLGMHGLYEANMAMHGCDLLINIGARFDDRITGRIDAFSPGSVKAHIDIDASSINKVIPTEIPILGDVGHVLEDLLKVWKSRGRKTNKEGLQRWWAQIQDWKKIDCLGFEQKGKVIRPQHALARLEALTKDHDRYICTEVGQHQMWAAQYLQFDDPNRWMTSGGLGTMGYGFPASIGVQMAHPDALVINVAGEASWLMNMQEMGTAVQYRLPVKQFILNNERLGMVRQCDEIERHTLAVVVDNEAGVLARVIGLFSGRGYNIESLTVAEIDHEGHRSRITVVTSGTPQIIQQIKAQLGRIVPVHEVHDLTVEGPSVERELGLFKVKGSGDKRVEALRLADIFRANVVDSTLTSFVFEITGTPEKIDAFADLMRPLGLLEVARTGVAALSRGDQD
ncbi:UNVERIFIED_CONTAM: hypothetical protein GTU68_055451 [Idotea baltica]|nr:hypothetical protein [Idotea baltica]